MKNTKLFQYILTGLFIFFIIVGAILFSTYRSKNSSLTNISITIWGTLDETNFDSFVSKYFNENDIKYTVNYTEKDSATFDSELVEALASGIGPDAIILPTDLIVRYINKIYTIPYAVLPELTFKDTFIQEGELYLNNNGVLALPFLVDPLVMYWNRDIFNNVGVTKPPTSWAEISALVPKMTKKDPAQNISMSTVALGEYRNVKNAKDIMSALLIQAGTSIVGISSDGRFGSTIQNGSDEKTSPASLALGYYTNFSNPSKIEYSWNRSLPNSIDAFTNGDLAIYFGFASEFVRIKEKNPNLNFDVALLPQIANAKVYNTFGKMQGFAIMKNSTNPAGVYTVLSSLVSAEAFPYWANIFNISSARRDILNVVEKSSAKTVFNKSAIMSKGWYDPNQAETNKVFQEMIESYTTGRETLSEVISTASDRLDSLLK
jgi:ABC-type glycerol-3-phosphate transport system substrate-binding protein